MVDTSRLAEEGRGEGESKELVEIRRGLAARVRARSAEIERAFIARVGLSAEESEVDLDSGAFAELETAVEESIELALVAIEKGESWQVAVPPAVAAQIRGLARDGASLEATLEAYSAVHDLLIEFITEEMGPLPQDSIGQMLKVQSQQSDKLMLAFAAEYMGEVARLDRSPPHRLAERIQRLLAGEPADTAGLDYDFGASHVGVIVVGRAPELAARQLAEELGCALLLVPRNPETLWAWLGAHRSVSFAEIEQASTRMGTSAAFAVGESRQGIEGWRLTHQEAQLALSMTLRKPQPLTRCSDVVLLAAATREDALSRFLIDAFLRPLEESNDAEVLKQTLRTYLGVGCNAASAAAALGVNRHTVQRRLRKIEESLGRPLDACRAELEVALRIDELSA